MADINAYYQQAQLAMAAYAANLVWSKKSSLLIYQHLNIWRTGYSAFENSLTLSLQSIG